MKYSNSRLAKFYNIPIINNFNDLAQSIGISTKTLYLLVNFKKNYYRSKKILKKNGSTRLLRVPSYSMKTVQRWIYEEILKKVPVSTVSMAFVPKRHGIIESGLKHKDNLFFLSMDIHNFFDSISRYSVKNFFFSLGFSSDVVYLLTELCTFDDSLPQGAVTSPYLANLICGKLDARILGLCKKRNIEYSRYADDLCFSSDKLYDLNKIVPIITEIAEDEGFEINTAKTHFSSNYSRKTILGITLNDNSIHANYELKRCIRAQIFNSITKGDYSNRQYILGMIAYISDVEPKYKNKIVSYIKDVSSREYVYSNKRLVDSYNANKFYKKLPDIVFVNPLDSY